MRHSGVPSASLSKEARVIRYTVYAHTHVVGSSALRASPTESRDQSLKSKPLLQGSRHDLHRKTEVIIRCDYVIKDEAVEDCTLSLLTRHIK